MGPTTLQPTLHSPHLEKGCMGREGTGLPCLPIPQELLIPHLLPALLVSDGLRPGLSRVLWLLGQPQQSPDPVELGKGYEPCHALFVPAWQDCPHPVPSSLSRLHPWSSGKTGYITRKNQR